MQWTDGRYSRSTDEALKMNYMIALEKVGPERPGLSTEDVEYDLASRFLKARVGVDGVERFVKWASERDMKREKRTLAYSFDRQQSWNNAGSGSTLRNRRLS